MKLSVQDAGVCDLLGMEDGYAAIARAGFEAIDWNIDHALPTDKIKALEYGNCIFEQPLDAVMAHYAQELAIIRKNGLSIAQCHAPFPAYMPGHPELLEYMIGIYKRCIEFCDRAGIPYIVIHGIGLNRSDRENTPESIEKLNRHLYASLIPTLLENHVTVCLEDLCSRDDGCLTEGNCANPHEAAAFIDSLNNEAGREVFGLCLDIGHLQLMAKDIRVYAPILGNRIKCLHIHDNDGKADQHLIPFGGTINWGDVCRTLKQIGYKGNLSFETFRQCRSSGSFDSGLVLPWLQMIAATGSTFRKHIQG